MALTVPIPALPVHPAPLGVADTAARLYDAEVNLHHARQSGIDAWISAAYDHLHLALQSHAEASALAAAATVSAGAPQFEAATLHPALVTTRSAG
jgi:hypothetical protein